MPVYDLAAEAEKERIHQQNLKVIKQNVLTDVSVKINGMMLAVLFEDYLDRKLHPTVEVLEPMIDEYRLVLQTQFEQNIAKQERDDNLPPGISSDEIRKMHKQALSEVFAKMRDKFKG